MLDNNHMMLLSVLEVLTLEVLTKFTMNLNMQLKLQSQADCFTLELTQADNTKQWKLSGLNFLIGTANL